MGRLKITERDTDTVARIKEQALALARTHSGQEAAIVAAGLAQAARMVLQQYPVETREALMEGMAAFFQGRDVDQEHQDARTRSLILGLS